MMATVSIRWVASVRWIASESARISIRTVMTVIVVIVVMVVVVVQTEQTSQESENRFGVRYYRLHHPNKEETNCYL